MINNDGIQKEKTVFDGANYKYSEITERIIKQAYHVYNALGHGFLEKVYENALVKKLKDNDFNVKQQFPLSVFFENELVGEYFADIVVDNKIIIELKAVEIVHRIHEIQLVNYLKATHIEVGLLINFGPKIQIKRKVLSQKQT